MAKQFFIKFGRPLIIKNAYRDYFFQKSLIDKWCDKLMCAKPWFSEHQSWLTVDLFDTSNNLSFMIDPEYNLYYKWLFDNAYKYWFINSYNRWVLIDWYEIEPWHWRYVWKKISNKLHINWGTFSDLVLWMIR